MAKSKDKLYIYSNGKEERLILASSSISALVKLKKIVGRKYNKYTLIGTT